MRWVAESKYLHCRGLCSVLEVPPNAAASSCRMQCGIRMGRSRQPGLGPGVLKPDVAFSAVPSPGIWQQHQHLLLHVTAAQEEPGSPSWVPIQAA